jgi:sterol desaturase/sphingolipid hydroxylase (fatty acid hydroxylase superfamily)
LGLLKKILDPLEEWIFTNQLMFINNIPIKFWSFQLNVIFEGILATLVTMLSIDFASYITHRLMHTNNLLWKMHHFHHTTTNLNFLSTYRQNPIEVIFLNSARASFAALGLSVFHLFFTNETPVILIQGLGAGFFIYMFTVNLHHSHIPIKYPKLLRFVLISPHVHHLHHSLDSKHFDKNFGVVFSIWDRMFATYYEEDFKMGDLHFGIKPRS